MAVQGKRIARYTLPIFLERATDINGDKYDYSEITEQHINDGVRSHVPIICNTCQYRWASSINHHINKKGGCPNCAGVAPWTFERFLIKAKTTHGDKFDYSQVTEHHINNGKNSRVPIICNTCEYTWEPTIFSHINGKHGCPDCAGNIPWTRERFMERAVKIHGDNYNYSQIIPQHIINQDSHVPVTCNICQYYWEPPITSHINRKNGCPDCSGKVQWTLERFKERGFKIHGNAYDYSQITEQHIINSHSSVPIICNNCKNKWTPSIGHHINRKDGCPHCRTNKRYSQAAIDWLKSIEQKEGIVVQCAISEGGEYKIPSPNGGYYKFDGYHAPTNTVYEYYGDYWHGNPKVYDQNIINPSSGKTYGELHQRTIDREKYIRSFGYNLVTKWETPLEDKQIINLTESLQQLTLNPNHIIHLDGQVELEIIQ